LAANEVMSVEVVPAVLTLGRGADVPIVRVALRGARGSLPRIQQQARAVRHAAISWIATSARAAKVAMHEAVPAEVARDSMRDGVPAEVARDSMRDAVPAEVARDSMRDAVPAEVARDSMRDAVPAEPVRIVVREALIATAMRHAMTNSALT
jgi:hypothetical protein